ncbi:MAG: o-succinylbenzoate synthase [Corynebacterium sp.]|nr:o-succinylbenzoate synthase [Corynebacterium sp.]
MSAQTILPKIQVPETLTVEELISRAHFCALPLRVRFRGITTRELVLFDGPEGWGEWAPFLEYPPEEAAQWLRAAIESAYLPALPRMRETVALNATVPAINGEELDSLLARYEGFSTFKIKVAEKGQKLSDDIARIKQVRAVYPSAVLRIDANTAWTPAEALEAARAFGPLQYMEQPVATTEQFTELAALIAAANLPYPVRLAADESIRRAADPLKVLATPAITNAVLKTAPLGGVRPTIAWMQKLSAAGKELTIASALDSSVGMNAPLAAIACGPIESLPAGLSTGTLMAEDLTEPREIIDGRMSTRPLAPEPERLESLRMPAIRKDWWIERLRLSFSKMGTYA